MKLKKGNKEYTVLAFVCVEKDNKEYKFKVLDIRDLKGYTLTDAKD